MRPGLLRSRRVKPTGAARVSSKNQVTYGRTASSRHRGWRTPRRTRGWPGPSGVRARSRRPCRVLRSADWRLRAGRARRVAQRMGLTVIDAGVIIGFLDANDSHHLEAHAALDDARSRNDRLVLPASAFAEVLVGPSRRGPAAVAAVRGLVERVPIDVEPLDLEIAMLAAAVRARHRSIKLPDALVIATASQIDADHLITTDRKWPPRSTLKLRASISEI